METTLFINRLVRIDYLIQHKATGSARELSERIGTTERSVFNYLKFMKKMGAPIVYCESDQSYIYEYDGGFFIGFVSRVQQATASA